MRKTPQIDGYTINKRGLIVGIRYAITSTGPEAAKDVAQLFVQKGGYKHVHINFVQEAKNVRANQLRPG